MRLVKKHPILTGNPVLPVGLLYALAQVLAPGVMRGW
jgi:hypothetical protein